MTFPWLTVLGLVPLVGAATLLLPVKELSRVLGMFFALIAAVVGVVVATLQVGGAALAEQVPWIPAFGAWWALGLNGMSLLMVLLTVLLTPVVLLAEWKLPNAGRWSPQVFVALVLFLESLSLFTFMADDVLLFYLFFEATLIPMYFLIGGFGGAERSAAALKFLLFSLAGGLVMLISVVGLGVVSTDLGGGTPTYLLAELAKLPIGTDLGRWLMVGFLVAFVVKAPMVPVHTWLPTTAEQATPGTSVLLVGILDKIGTFGMIKFCLGLFPEASLWVAPVMVILALISIIYGAVAAIGSSNLLRLVAYTSISHFGFMVLGIYTFTTVGVSGTIFYMLNHGFSTAALFLVVGFLINRRGSAAVADFGGVQKPAPILAGVFLMAGLSGLALPGMSSFVSEFMVLAGAWSRQPWPAAVAALGTVLAAVYILLMYQKTMTGPVTEATAAHFTTDATAREKWVVAPLLAIILLLGFVPGIALQVANPAAAATISHVGAPDPVAPFGEEGK
jgi:proton-translocating NADH-quinone oxidoreductase, chain M